MLNFLYIKHIFINYDFLFCVYRRSQVDFHMEFYEFVPKISYSVWLCDGKRMLTKSWRSVFATSVLTYKAVEKN